MSSVHVHKYRIWVLNHQDVNPHYLYVNFHYICTHASSSYTNDIHLIHVCMRDRPVNLKLKDSFLITFVLFFYNLCHFDHFEGEGGGDFIAKKHEWIQPLHINAIEG